VDAAHFVHSGFLGYLWCLDRVFLKTSPGRKRYNVLGALDAVDKTLTTVTNDGYIKAVDVCELIAKVSQIHTGVPITLIMDNAAYQVCKLVKAKAEECKVDLLFLPPYSPNLNLIERLWKFVKKKCLVCRYHETFADFQEAIRCVIESTGTTHRAELESFLTWKFQSYSKVRILA
jgi:transposase